MLRFLTAIVMLALCTSSPASQMLPTNSCTWITESTAGFIVLATPDGTVYRGQRQRSGLQPWIVDNVFSSAGVPRGELVGIGVVGGDIFYALTPDGTTYFAGRDASSWQIAGNIFSSASQSPAGDQFVTMGTMQGGPDPGGATLFALTAKGNIYQLVIVDWLFIGNVFGEQPVQNDPTTWGRIKADRR